MMGEIGNQGMISQGKLKLITLKFLLNDYMR